MGINKCENCEYVEQQGMIEICTLGQECKKD